MLNSLRVKLNLTLQSSNKSLLEIELKSQWVTDNHVSAFTRNFTSLSGRGSSFGKTNLFRFSWTFPLGDLGGVTCLSGFPGFPIAADVQRFQPGR